ncbi:sensor domain-containing protein [Rhodocyclus gracilis]|uniref:PAS domain S-box protein n=1 Tax=Rhodocyclus tenuis TaxID=1066 RepID=A0A6L5K0H5_RHOTE|nr:EAL domain-containing protein [Rhodocyclus gracilis]MQY52414.1 PAS domain S-box protein [Rhodocyclus gracilis]
MPTPRSASLNVPTGDPELAREQVIPESATPDSGHERSMLAALSQTIPDLIWLKDATGRYLACNAAFERFVGSSAGEVIGQRDEALVPADMAAHFRDSDQHVIATGQPLLFEEWQEFADKGPRALNTQKSPVYHPDGRLLGVLGIARDVTERHTDQLLLGMRDILARAVAKKPRLDGLLQRMLDAAVVLPCFTGGEAWRLRADGSIRRVASTGGREKTNAALREANNILPKSSRLAQQIRGIRPSCMCAGRNDGPPAWLRFAETHGTSTYTPGDKRQLVLPVCVEGVPVAALLLDCSGGQCLPGKMPHLADTLCSMLSDAAERRQSLIHADQQQQNLAGVFAALADLVFVVGYDGTIMHHNAAVTELLGLRPAGLIGRPLTAAYPMPLKDEVERAINDVLTGQISVYTLPLLRADGTWLDAETRTARGRWNGRPAIIGVTRDISERVRTETALRESEQRFRQVFQMSPIAASLSRLEDGRYLEVNEAYSHLFGWSRSELLQSNALTLGIWGSERSRNAWIARLHENSRLDSYEAVFFDRLGNPCQVLVSATLVVIDAEVCSLTMIYDLSERRRAEAEAEAARDLVRDVTDALPLAVFRYRFDDDGRFHLLFASQSLLEQCGVGSSEAMAHPRRMLARIAVEEQGAFIAAVRRAWLHQEALDHELRVAAPDGGERWLYLHSEPTCLADGTCVHNGYSQDITARRQAEAASRLAAGVFEHAHEGIVICNADATIVDVNRNFCELSGYSREDVLGRNAIALQAGDLAENVLESLYRTLKKEGHWRGEVWSRRKDGSRYAERVTVSSIRTPEGEISHYVAIFSDITLIKQHQRELERMAHYDALTQLPNRVLLADRLRQSLAHAKRCGRMLGLAYLDLDGFKPINDHFGHDAGDRLLVEVARRLRNALRGDDTVARLGGDEFVLLLSELGSIEECKKSLDRILDIVALPFHQEEAQFCVTASIGASLFPQDDADPDTLLRHADQAMYLAKQAGRNCYHIYDSEQDRRARAQHDSVSRIHDALQRNEFVLYYQPKVDMRRGLVYGAEALIRWQHPEKGLLAPSEFLPDIENSDFAITLGEWVMETAIDQLAHWRQTGLDISVSINVAAREIADSGFVDRLKASFARHPELDPSALELEVLETAALGDVGQATRVIEGCHALGVRIALDDFGTGYSSLTYFRRLPVDTLKIDRSFVRDMLCDEEDFAIVEAVIALTRAFHRQVVAEGVESSEHGLALLHLGCDQAQGYGIARPMPAAELPAWVAAFTPDRVWSREDLSLNTLFSVT